MMKSNNANDMRDNVNNTYDNTNDTCDNGSISVVISTYDDPISFVKQCLHSLYFQDKISEIIIVDSSKNDDIKNYCISFGSKIRYIYTEPSGLSDARNKGICVAKENIVAFTDVDCTADKNWAYNIYNSFRMNETEKTKEVESMRVAIVGGKVLPKWMSGHNKIFENSSIAQGFYSLFDMGNELKEVDQIFGGNFAINRALVADAMTSCAFSSELGRKGGNLLCGEEIDLCRKILASGLKIVYNPSVVVWHQIPESRMKFKWMWKRTYYSGITRAILGGKPTPKVVNYVKYNFYDVMFLVIFVIPYVCGLSVGFVGRRMKG